MLRRRCTRSIPRWGFVALLLSLPTFAQESERDQRLQALVERMEKERGPAHVPGMALAVVIEDEVVLSRGFGFADLETERPVTPETLFAAGSTTKAFTAAAIGTLVDEGKMSWDDPILDYLDYLDLAVKGEGNQDAPTVRDLLSHRTGFGRMSLLWGGGPEVPRETILHATANAEPTGVFRKEFHYSNTMFLAAGVAAGKVAGTSWDELVTERLLVPLGMKSSNLSSHDAKKDERLAVGYQWKDERFERKVMLDLDRIGPAGSLNSNVLDMAQWVRMQLAHGRIGETRILSEERVSEMWDPQIPISPTMSYGMGWFLQERNDERVIEHGGNIDGFSAQVAFFPEHDMGFVLLANVGMTSLQQGSISVFIDTMLADLPEEAPVDAENTLDEYLGTYLANFAHFEDAEFEVTDQDGKLFVDIPGQTNFELRAPDDEGRWSFALTGQIAVSFTRDEDDQVIGLKMYQSGAVFEVPRKDMALAADAAALEDGRYDDYVGSYLANFASWENVAFEVQVKSGALAVDVPGQMLFELHEPDEEGRWVFTITDEIAISFDRGEGGEVTGLKMYQAGETYELPRMEGASDDLPSMEEIHELRGTTARRAEAESSGAVRLTGTAYAPECGIEGTYLAFIGGPDHFASELDFGVFGTIVSTLSSGQVSTWNSIQGLRHLEGGELDDSRLEHPWTVSGDWTHYFDRMQVKGQETLNGRLTYVIGLGKDDHRVTSYVDAETGDVLRQRRTLEGSGLSIPVTTDFADFREVNGIRRAFETTVSNPFTGRLILQVIEMDGGQSLPDGLFELEVGETRLESPD